jgi:hypothetical protein
MNVADFSCLEHHRYAIAMNQSSGNQGNEVRISKYSITLKIALLILHQGRNFACCVGGR